MEPEARAAVEDSLGRAGEATLDVDEEDYAAFLQSRGRRPAAGSEIAESIAALKFERVERRLDGFGVQARSLAARLGRADLDVLVEANRLRLSRSALAGFWASLTHVVRNAVDHADLESRDERCRRQEAAEGHSRAAPRCV